VACKSAGKLKRAVIPLRRRDEQNLWEKFRAACDQFFAQRKLASGEADKFRKDNFEAKSALCQQLEQAFDALTNEKAISQLLSQIAQEFRQIATVPRSEEEALEQRYAQAQQALQSKLHQLQQVQAQNLKQLCLSKLQLCQSVEALLSADMQLTEAGQDGNQKELQLSQFKQSWSELAALPGKLNTVLNQRFTDAVKALESVDHGYRLMLDENLHSLDSALLQQEIISGIASPVELSRERLQMQVDVLQNSLKRGNSNESQTEILYKIIGLPARLDSVRAQRLEQIVTMSEAL